MARVLLLSYVLDYTVTPPHNLLFNGGEIMDCKTHGDDTEPRATLIVRLEWAVDSCGPSCDRGGIGGGDK